MRVHATGEDGYITCNKTRDGGVEVSVASMDGDNKTTIRMSKEQYSAFLAVAQDKFKGSLLSNERS